MTFVQLASVQHRVTVGVPLPFHVRDADQTLLLARGQVLHTPDQLSALVRRGALVDGEEVPTEAAGAPRPASPHTRAEQAAVAAVQQARPEQLPALMRTAVNIAVRVLREPPGEGFETTLHSITEPLLAIIERDPDLAIFQVLRQEGNYLTQYGVNHAIHCAITAFLVGTRLGGSPAELRRTFQAALTMNLSMFELQGELAIQSTPVTDEQRARILSHPQRSVALLEAAGIRDADWLHAVSHHHDAAGEVEDGLAALLRRVDIYTAKLSPRSHREAMAADVAARLMFSGEREHPVTAAIVKEFGLYPPGCHVKLASGETGVVVRRGERAHTPWVAATISASGTAFAKPLARNSAQRPFGVTAVLRPGAAGVRFTPDALMRACA